MPSGVTTTSIAPCNPSTLPVPTNVSAPVVASRPKITTASLEIAVEYTCCPSGLTVTPRGSPPLDLHERQRSGVGVALEHVGASPDRRHGAGELGYVDVLAIRTERHPLWEYQDVFPTPSAGARDRASDRRGRPSGGAAPRRRAMRRGAPPEVSPARAVLLDVPSHDWPASVFIAVRRRTPAYGCEYTSG